VPSVSKLLFRLLKETKIPIHMKKFICSIIFLLCFVVAWAQSPNLMSYQAIIRNSANQLIVSSPLGVRVSLLQGSASGTVVFREIYNPNPMTNSNGLLGLNIGSGVSITGSFGQVNWSQGPYFVQVEVDPTGGTNYSISSVSQLLSVPYALHAKTAESFPPGTQAGEMNYWNGSAWVRVTPGLTGQSLVFCYGVPTWGGCIPQVTTASITSIFADRATSGGAVVSDGGSMVTVRGVAYGTATSPTISGSITSNGSGTGTYTSTLMGLTGLTTYYVRAYATNSVGTAYGNELSFTTPAFTCGTSTVTDVDGNSYNTVQIGTQCWTKSNLKVSKYRNGDNIPTGLSNPAWQNTTADAYAIYDNNPVNDGLYGKLYNHYAVTDTRGLCPTGWHVPTDVEWTTLENFLGGSSVAGGAMKSTATQPTPGGWNSPNTGATNSSGFTAGPGGLRYDGGAFSGVGIVGYWWSSSLTGTGAWYRALNATYGAILRLDHGRTFGFSVRCLMD
jgi:uncharacterized protein (TIGR02145 family)